MTMHAPSTTGMTADPYAPIGRHLDRVVETIAEVATAEAGRHDYDDCAPYAGIHAFCRRRGAL